MTRQEQLLQRIARMELANARRLNTLLQRQSAQAVKLAEKKEAIFTYADWQRLLQQRRKEQGK